MRRFKYWGPVAALVIVFGVAYWWWASEVKERDKSVNNYVESQQAIDQSEEKENQRIKNFFSDLRSVYGYLYTAKDGSLQLFLKIDEALNEGELSGSLFMVTDEENKNKHYTETRYTVNGITDGLMLELFTTVEGKETKLKGNFHEGADGFNVSFWTTDQKLYFHAVTEDEFKQNDEAFKRNAQRKSSD